MMIYTGWSKEDKQMGISVENEFWFRSQQTITES